MAERGETSKSEEGFDQEEKEEEEERAVRSEGSFSVVDAVTPSRAVLDDAVEEPDTAEEPGSPPTPESPGLADWEITEVGRF